MLIDTHSHLDFPDFAQDLDAVLERAAAAGVTEAITIGTSVEGSRRAIALAEKYPNVFAVVGVHPNSATEAEPGFATELRELAQHPRVVAIGEAGLDYYRLPGGPEDPEIKRIQAEVFRQQLDLAVELGLNVVVHERDAWDDTFAQLRPYRGKLRTVFHCFGKSPAQALALIEQNHLVSFTGIITFKNAPLVQETAAAIPADAFMVETDCPFLAPIPYRGKRCEPGYTRNVAEKIAGLRGESLETIAANTTETARKFFRFP